MVPPKRADKVHKDGGASIGRGRTVYDRLTDTKLYPGTHKYRFDDNGKGWGLSGRDSISKGLGSVPLAHVSPEKVIDLSQITRTYLHSGPQARLLEPATISLTSVSSPRRKRPSIFERLNDPKSFGGTHKLRFDKQGRGKGLAGRDSVPKGSGTVPGQATCGVTDLGQVTRSYLNY